MRILVVNGPNMNWLGKRDPHHYGTLTLAELEARVEERAKALGVEVAFFQSNHEGALIDFLQQEAPRSQGLIINPAGLTPYGLSLRDTLSDIRLPAVEVHLSNIHAREEWRRHSVFSEVVRAVIAGMGWRGYLYALDFLVATLRGEG